MDKIERLMRLRAADPGDADVPYMLAQEHAKLGDVDASVGFYDECIGLDAEYHYAYFHKARVLEDAGRVAEAVKVLEEGLRRAEGVGAAKAVNEIGGYLAALRDGGLA